MEELANIDDSGAESYNLTQIKLVASVVLQVPVACSCREECDRGGKY
jgi:hypothetical protein